VTCRPIARQRMLSVLWSYPRLYNETTTIIDSSHSCESGVEYLHRDHASRRRWRKEKSQIWDSKIWSRVPRNSDPRKTTLASASSIYKTQTRPLVREGAPQKQDRNCQTVINIWSWLTHRQSQCDFDLIDSSVGSHGVSSRKKTRVCQIVICELL
jgi:hypothetical protein